MKSALAVWLLFLACSPFLSAETPPRAEFWVDLLMAEPLEDENDMWADLQAADVVFLGETHRLDRHHRMQVEVLRKILEAGRPVILGLEQIEARDQAEVERFNSGEIDFEQLAEAIEWKKQWRNYADYRELVETAQKAGARVVGLNAPREIVREVSKVGVDALKPAARAQLSEKIHTDDPTYERLMNLALSVHASFDPSFLRNVFEAQVARDDHMAESIVHAMSEVEGEKKPIGVVVAGSGHIQFGLGTPDRVRFRLPKVNERIVLMSESGDLELTPMEKEMRRAVEIHHRDVHFIRRPAGDYLYVKEWNPESED